MLTIKIIYNDGDYSITRINTTLEEAKRYYVGKYFNLGIEGDLLKKCISIVEIRRILR